MVDRGTQDFDTDLNWRINQHAGDCVVNCYEPVKEPIIFNHERACIYIQSRWRGYCCRKYYNVASRQKVLKLIYSFKRRISYGNRGQGKYFVISLFKHFEDGVSYYTLRAQENSKSKRCHQVTI